MMRLEALESLSFGAERMATFDSESWTPVPKTTAISRPSADASSSSFSSTWGSLENLIGKVSGLLPVDVSLLPWSSSGATAFYADLLAQLASSRAPLRLLSWQSHGVHPILAGVDAHSSVFLLDPKTSAGWFPASSHGLHHEKQTNVTCLAWRPQSSGTLAVGSEHGVLLWRLGLENGTLHFARSMPPCTLLSTADQTHVSALAWSPDGSYLVSGSGAHSGLCVWDIALKQSEGIGRGSRSLTKLLAFSPDGSALLQVFHDSGFRVWETASWTYTYVATPKTVQDAIFLPGPNNLFVISQGLRLKFYSVQPKKGGGLIEVIPVPCGVHLSSNSLPAKCVIQKLELDLEGRYLLVKFSEGNKRLLCQLEQTPLPKVGLLGWIPMMQSDSETEAESVAEAGFVKRDSATFLWQSGSKGSLWLSELS